MREAVVAHASYTTLIVCAIQIHLLTYLLTYASGSRGVSREFGYVCESVCQSVRIFVPEKENGLSYHNRSQWRCSPWQAVGMH